MSRSEVEIDQLLRFARFLLIDSSDFSRFPAGGTLAFARQIMCSFGREVALVGFTTDGTPVGKWGVKRFGRDIHAFLPIGRWQPSARRPVVPARLRVFKQTYQHRRAIMSSGIGCVFTQCMEVLLAARTWGWESICFNFPGIENPFRISRYRWARVLANPCDRMLGRVLRRVDVVLASADRDAMASLSDRLNGAIPIRQLATRYDACVFRPTAVSRQVLGIAGKPVIACSGRLSAQKGWDLVLAAFKLLLARYPQALLVFIGDGEDRCAVEEKIRSESLDAHVLITGFCPPDSVARYVNASDVVVVGSHHEGWSISMLEALGCGKPIVSTAVSGAKELIYQDENGFIIPDRRPETLCRAMHRALRLPNARCVSLRVAARYSVDTLRRDLERLWPALANH